MLGTDDPAGSLQAAWRVKEQLRTLVNPGLLQDAAAATIALADLVDRAAMAETKRLYRTVCRWWAEIEVLIVIGATTAKVEAKNTAIKHIKRTARGYRNPENYKSRILLRSAARVAAWVIISADHFPGNLEEPPNQWSEGLTVERHLGLGRRILAFGWARYGYGPARELHKRLNIWAASACRASVAIHL